MTNNHSTTLEEREQTALAIYNTALSSFHLALSSWDNSIGTRHATVKRAQADLAVAVADRQNADIGIFVGGPTIS